MNLLQRILHPHDTATEGKAQRQIQRRAICERRRAAVARERALAELEGRPPRRLLAWEDLIGPPDGECAEEEE